ncbi:hypothetical protein NU688_32720 [Variovorax sp. ZS18.2.2]|uniref:hypothetical protein n=1 Tax=Variovorax sp. ZS18.2.2 TaxID=2971255 RepID=UPI00215131F8|nr:hypothetical protein [Variovorax sp. ZS18.2.2]MCR6480960.1 hypothetical protein [Variovorax sp. ZS18.2.2]
MGQAQNDKSDVRLLDDGKYAIVVNKSGEHAGLAGYLLVQRPDHHRFPLGYAWIGTFSQEPDGTWQASVAVPYDDASNSDFMRVVWSVERLDAIVALWKARKEAFYAI